jgi:nucleotide-binding universal stress UspA family protein
MFKTILVPLDGSSRAEYALPMATRLARHSGGTLILVRAVSSGTQYWPVISSPSPPMVQVTVGEEMREAQIYLKKMASSTELAGMEVAVTARFGSAVSVILSAATEYHADLIVLCSHGYTGMAHIVMGSVAEKVARHAPVPVLMLHEKVTFPEVKTSKISQPLRVLVPLDGSVYAKAALTPAVELLTALAAPEQKKALHLVRVIEPATEQKEERQMEQQRGISRAKSYLSRTTDLMREGYLVPALSKHHITVSWSVALDADRARAIVRVVENGEDAEGVGVFGGCDLIAMATHGRGGLHRLAIGSVTERVLQTTKRPILIVRPAKVLERQASFLETEGNTILN